MGTDPRAVLGRRALDVVVSFVLLELGPSCRCPSINIKLCARCKLTASSNSPKAVDNDGVMMEPSQVSGRVQLTYLRQCAIHSRTKHKKVP